MEASMIFDFLPKNTSTGRLMVIVDEDDEDLGSPSSPSSCSESGDEGHSGCTSAASDLTDDASSSSTDSLRSLTGSTGGSPLDEMSPLMEDLPVKRGLSRHFNGKSQSFTSLANARCLQDLIKPVRRTPSSSSKPMRSCRSYATGLDHHQGGGGPSSPPQARAWQHHQHSPKASIAKRPVRNTSFHASRPPMHPHSSGNLAGQAMLFA